MRQAAAQLLQALTKTGDERGLIGRGIGQECVDQHAVDVAGGQCRGEHGRGQVTIGRALAHRAGHTLLLLAGPAANDIEIASLHAVIQSFAAASAMFESAVTLATRADASRGTNYLAPDAADRLGIKGITLVAMRPDGYIGLRSDSDHLAAVERYQRLIQAGKNHFSAQNA